MEMENQPCSGEARIPTQTEQAIIDYGKQVLLKSSETAIDFHKTMLGVSATFGTLITTVTPILIWGNKDSNIPLPEGWFLILPPLLMILSAVAFSFGYYPRYVQFNPNVVDEIRKVREEIIKSRRTLAIIGLSLFCTSLLILTFLVIWLRSTAAPCHHKIPAYLTAILNCAIYS